MTVLGDAFCVIFRAPLAMPKLSASFSSSRVLTVLSARGLLRVCQFTTTVLWIYTHSYIRQNNNNNKHSTCDTQTHPPLHTTDHTHRQKKEHICLLHLERRLRVDNKWSVMLFISSEALLVHDGVELQQAESRCARGE